MIDRLLLRLLRLLADPRVWFYAAPAVSYGLLLFASLVLIDD